jgi:disease resistance protein RPM1
VSVVPPEELKKPDKEWAGQVRELLYDMEDAVDAFMLRVAHRQLGGPGDGNIFKKITNKVKKFKERHQISDKIKDIKNIAKELGDLRARYKFSGGATTKNKGVDPRVINLYKREGKLVGIDEPRDELVRRLTYPKDHKSLKIVSIVGTRGLGKTTLAKIVFDQLKQ